MSATFDGSMENWFNNLAEEAEKQKLMEEINKLVEVDAEYCEKKDLIDRQIKLLEDKKIELLNDKEQLKCDVGNKYLEQKKSKYRLKMAKKKDIGPFGSILGL